MALELFVNDNNNGIEMNVDSNIQDLSLGQTVVKEAVKELYKCIYGETTFDQITEAIASGKFPYLVNDRSTYWLVEDYADYIGEYDFEFTDTMGYIHFAYCTGEGWRSGTVTPLFAHQKVTELNDQSNDNQIPSAKCVYDELNEKQDTLTFDNTPTEDSTNPVTSGGVYGTFMNALDTVSGWIGDVQDQIPTKTSDLENDSGFITGIDSSDVTDALGYTPYDSTNPNGYVNATQAANAAPVQSVNGQTGAVSLGASDVGALPDTTPIPTKTSDLANNGADGTSTYVEADDLAPVATSGAYSDLTGQPTDLSDFNNDVGFITSAPVSSVDGKTGAVNILPSGGNAGQVLKKNSATNYDVHWANETEIYPSGYCTTAGGTATKVVNCSLWTATPNTYLHILIAQPNSYADAITMKINASSPIPVYINGDPSSTTNYSLPGGSYIAFYDGTNIYLRTDGQLPGNIVGEAASTEAKLATKADSAGASANYAAKLTARIPYGECDNTSTSTAFTATVPGITELKDGVTMLLYNGVVTSASGFTININGLGAKPSYNNMTMGNPVTPTSPTRDTTIFNINYAFLFVYSETLVSGGCWIGYRGYDANTNTIGYQLRTNNTTMKTADKFYRYRLLFTSADGTKWIPANTSTSTNATSARTPNTRAIDPFGEIVWYGTTTAIEANANVTAGQLWQEYYSSYTNIGYSFNNTGAAQTMTANLPIYIKCTPQADGSAIIDPTTPYTQTLPTTDDGKIYIYLGRAYNATNFEITMNHPVYYYKNGGIRFWTGMNMPTKVSELTNDSGFITLNDLPVWNGGVV